MWQKLLFAYFIVGVTETVTLRSRGYEFTEKAGPLHYTLHILTWPLTILAQWFRDSQ